MACMRPVDAISGGPEVIGCRSALESFVSSQLANESCDQIIAAKVTLNLCLTAQQVAFLLSYSPCIERHTDTS